MPTLPMTGSERPVVRESHVAEVEEQGEVIEIAQDEEEDHEEGGYFALERRRSNDTLRREQEFLGHGEEQRVGIDMEIPPGRSSMESIDEDGSLSPTPSPSPSPSPSMSVFPSSCVSSNSSFGSGAQQQQDGGGGGYFSLKPPKAESTLRTPRPGDFSSENAKGKGVEAEEGGYMRL